jgi:tyrosyl-tRNA synthetase
MSKSLGNYIGIAEPANDIFGKVMSISDTLMWRYFELLSLRPLAEIAQLKQEAEAGANPRNIKVQLAQELVARFHSQAAAEAALADFEARFKQNALPDDMPELTLVAGAAGLAIGQVLKEAGLVTSTSEAMRMIDGGGVKADGEKVTDKKQVLLAGCTVVLQVGKRKFARVTLD